jgi:hypothetical protein
MRVIILLEPQGELDLSLVLATPFIHAYNGYMEKLQILFSNPQIKRLRRVAQRQDRPVSELVRAAVDLWLYRCDTESDQVTETPPTFSCGAVLANPETLRDRAHCDRSGA